MFTRLTLQRFAPHGLGHPTANRRAWLVAAFAGQLAVASADPFPSKVGDTIGMNTGVLSLNLTAQDFGALRAAGVHYIRAGFRWHEVERVKGQYDWSGYDRLAAQMVEHGLKPIFVVAYGNSLYDDNDRITMNSPEEREGYARFAAAGVARYDAPDVIWEIWNEPNAHHFWRASTRGNTVANARERATNYLSLLEVTVSAMRQASTNARIITGGAIGPDWVITQAWHDELMDRGLLDLVDGLGIHNYKEGSNHAPETHVLRGIQSLRNMICYHGGARDFPILHTEWGMDTNELNGTAEARLHTQAALVIRMPLLCLLEGVGLNVTYQWREQGRGHYHVYRPEAPLPAYRAISVYAKELGAFTFAKRLPTERSNDFVLLFEDDARRKLVAWTAGEPHTLRVSVGTAKNVLEMTSLLGETRTFNVEQGMITLTLTGDPQYVDLGMCF